MIKSYWQAGDRVRIVSRWPPDGKQNPEGRMDRWLGKEMTISYSFSTPYSPHPLYKMVEDCGTWTWHPNMIFTPDFILPSGLYFKFVEPLDYPRILLYESLLLERKAVITI